MRSRDSLTINKIVADVLNIHPIVADSIINRNFEASASDFKDLKAVINGDFTTLEGIVDTEAEVAFVKDFESAAKEYMDIFENKMLPVLRSNDTVARRAQDSIDVITIQLNIESIYAVIADSIINRNLLETRRELVKVKELAETNLAHIGDLMDTEEEIAQMNKLGKEYREYIAFFEDKMLPEIIGGASMSRIVVLDEQIDVIRNKLMETINWIQESLSEETNKAVAAEQTVRNYDAQIDGTRDAALLPLMKIEELLAAEQEEADHIFDETIQKAILLSMIFIIIGIAAAMTIALLLTRAIKSSVLNCLKLAAAVALGDLTTNIEIKGKDEIAQLSEAISKMQLKLREVVSEVTNASREVLSGSEQLSQTA